ncbi:unnamed protein product [Didymodactylos carnosus]|uniref:Non-specific serine/threonine protein kinase n=1 Tax=Didymodactylos carnosus TaxID=1234261 RepID=A0A8S2FMU9_9BILA|nr:unnamed protein product [Didymodactylos carnosus]CAF4289924.1 unnamed protein product [Didymodactylos carnosus]
MTMEKGFNKADDDNRTPILGRDYNELASICDDYLRRYENKEYPDNSDIVRIFTTDEIPKLIVSSILKSMKYGSAEGIKRFSRLLQIIDLYPSTLATIENKLNDIPCWMFFDCLYQITAYLDKPIASKLYPVIDQIITLYPQAIVYPFKVSYERLKDQKMTEQMKRQLQIIKQKLARLTMIDDFILALERLNSPHIQFQDYMKEILVILKKRERDQRDLPKFKELVLKLKQTVFHDQDGVDDDEDESELLGTSADKPVVISTQDSIYDDKSEQTSTPNTTQSKKISLRKQLKQHYEKEFDKILGKDCENFLTLTYDHVHKAFQALFKNLEKYVKTKTSETLSEYSTWFSATFRQQTVNIGQSSKDIEIPGQYTSKKRPILEHHIKIVGFDEKILTLNSLRQPKRLTIRGHDENDYPFLIKAGEDIRQDQRIQALFNLMNDLYSNDPNCNQSYSSQINVRTYKVIPMTTKIGIIEWLDNTKTLKDVLDSSYTDEESQEMQTNITDPRAKYYEFFTKVWSKVPDKSSQSTATSVYGESYIHCKKEDIQENFRQIQKYIPYDLLRRAYYKMANSHEGFYTLRSQFIVSYAVLCTSQYILGIGDRHQSNFLIDTTSGQSIDCQSGVLARVGVND